ncbi:hypothetical protein JCM9279_005524 [Rhodotorula babjevae]
MLPQAAGWAAQSLLSAAGPALEAAQDSNPVGSGSQLPLAVLITATISAGLSTILSIATVWLQLKHYHKPRLERLVVRILVMVPIYSIASLISLYSLELAFFLDAIRDVYEAFVIYCFFSLLVEYLGGERSLIITLHGRDPVPHPWPVNLFLHPMDASDPFTFLGLKRGILQYVQIKPLLALSTVIMKATGTYKDGALAKDSGYTYVSIVYNLSVSLSLYCLAMFWVATSSDLKPYRPMPKFLSVKGIIFFSFWQGFAVSIGVAAGLLKSSRYDTEQLSLAIQDTLVCYEMPLFAFLHLYAFSHTDYIDDNHVYSGRLPMWHAIKDAFGYKDLFLDSIGTLRGSGFSYRTYEPASGALHASGLVRDRRIRAGLRYSTADGGRKYWLNQPGREEDAYGRRGDGMLGGGLSSRPIHEVHRRLEERVEAREGYAPRAHDDEVLHVDPEWAEAERAKKRAMDDSAGPLGLGWWEGGRAYDQLDDGDVSDAESLEFHPVDETEEKEVERLYRESRELEYGDWKYPVVDASREAARRRVRDEEDAILSGRVRVRANKALRPFAKHRPGSYGALAERQPLVRGDSLAIQGELEAAHKQRDEATRPRHQSSARSDQATSSDHPIPVGTSILTGASHVLHAALPLGSPGKDAMRGRGREHEEQGRLPPDAVDLVVEDVQAEQEEQMRQRRRGEPGGKKTRVYRVAYVPPADDGELGEAGRHLDPETAREGATVKSPVSGERAHVLDVVERDEEADGPVPGRAADADADSPPRSASSSSGGSDDQDEVVRIAVQEKERNVKQAGVDEAASRRSRGPFPHGHPVLTDSDNPWR